MSATIDERIVEMKFDNKDFEKNVSTSMSTLEKLQNALKFTDSNKSLKELESATKSIDFSSMSSAVDAIGNRFSTMGIIGMTVISRLTNAAIDMGKRIVTAIPSQIAHGGWQRALNVEQAKFQLDGLGIAWEKVADDIDHAVQDTAYGADEAAKAASMLAASGVAYGGVIETLPDGTKKYSDMGRSLRAISGVAAMTNASYSEIADIFTTVAGNGKLMSDQMNRLASRGLNVAANLGKVWGKSENEVRQMVKDGKVNFQMFADAMDEAFGEHATKANDTLQGSMANMRSALSRIGQDFAQTIQTQTPQVFNALKGYFNKIRTFTKPFADNIFTPIFTKNMERVASIIDHFTNSFPKLEEGSVALSQYNRVITYLGYLMDGLVNLFYDLLIAIQPIKNAFKEVFSDIFGSSGVDKLENFSKSFRSLTERLAISDETADKVKRTFKGVFSVFDILGQVISAVIHAILPATKSIGGLADGFLTITANIGDNIVAFDQWIRSSKLFENFIGKVSDVIAPVFSKIKSVFLGIFDVFGEISGINFGGLSTVSEKISAAFEPMHKRMQKLGEYLEKAKPLLVAIGNVVKSFVVGAIKLVGNTLDQFFDGASFKTLIDILNGIAISGLTLSLKKVVDFFRGLSGTIVKPVTKFTNILTDVKNTLMQYQADLKADILQKIAIAIAVLAGSLWVLSSIDSRKLAESVAAVGGLMAELMGAFAIFNKLTSVNVSNLGFIGSIKSMVNEFGKATKLKATSIALIALAGSVLILAAAVKLLSTIPSDELWSSALAVGVLLAALSGAMVLLSKYGDKMAVSAISIVAVAVAVNILASAVKKLADIDADSLANALIAVLSLMAMLVISMVTLTGSIAVIEKFLGKTNMVAIAVALVAFGVALELLANVVKKFGDMDLPSLAKGLIAAAAGMLVMAAAIAIAGKAGTGGLAGGVGMLFMAVALEVLVNVVKRFADMGLPSLAKGIIAMGAAVFIITEAMVVLGYAGPLAALGAVGVLVMAAAMAVLTVSLVALSKIEFTSLLKAIFSMSAALLVLGINGAILGALSPLLLAAAAAIAAFSKALFIFIPALFALSQLSFGTIFKALGALLSLSVGLVPVAAVLALISPLLLLAGAGLAILGVGFIAAGAGATLLASGLQSLILLLPVIGNSIAEFIKILGDLLLGILDVITEAGPKIFEVASMLFDGFLTLIAEYAPRIVETIVTVIVGIVQAIADHTQDFVEAALGIVEGFINGLTNGIPKVVAAAANFVISMIEGLAKGIRDNTDRLIRAIDELVESIFYALGAAIANIPEIGKSIVKGLGEGLGFDTEAINAATGLIDNAISAIKESILGVVQLGRDFVQGFIDGIKEFGSNVWTAAKGLATTALGAVQDTQDSSSPAKETKKLGNDFADGYEVGIEEGSDDAAEAAKKMAEEAVNGLDAASRRAEQIGAHQAENAKAINNSVISDLRTTAMEEERINKHRADDAIAQNQRIIDSLSTTTAQQEKFMTRQASNTKKAYRDMSYEAQRNAMIGVAANDKTSKSWDILSKLYNLTTKDLTKYGETVGLTTDEMKEAVCVTDDLTESTSKAGKAASKAKDEFKEFKESLNSTLESKTGGMNFFNKLELKTETTAASILENMRSNIDGVASWTARLAQVAERGLDQGLIKVLAQAGLNSYDQVSAFLQMSDEQIAEANQLFALQAEGRAYAVNTIGDSYLAAGQNIATGLANGVREGQTEAVTAIAETDTAMQEQQMNDWDMHSPSGVTRGYGQNMDLGLMTGISGYASKITSVVAALCRQIKWYFDTGLRKDYFVKLGNRVGDGLKEGIKNSGDAAIAQAESVARRVGEIMANALRVESPSRVTMWIGKMVDLGLAKGMSDNSKSVEDSSKDLAKTAMNPLKEAMSKASDYVADNIDVNPTITPMLDLTNLMNQADSISGLFTDRNVRLSAEADRTNRALSAFEEANGNGRGSTYNFTQNNYSPKALSRVDIYRNTNNQFSALKAVTEGA